MKSVQLENQWELRRFDTGKVYPTVVPSSVCSTLISAGDLSDPYYRDNEMPALKLADGEYEYRTTFDASLLLGCERVELVFEGIDTLADIYLNGTHIANTDNMFRMWRLDVTKYIKAQNELTVALHSPTKFIRDKFVEDPYLCTKDAMKGMPYLRKAHYMFGWDWGPRIPDAGIWRPVTLQGYDFGRIDGINVKQMHKDGKVTLNFDIDVFETKTGKICRYQKCCGDFSAVGKLTGPDGNVRILTQEELLNGVTVEKPELWWPNGYGAQPLYTVEVTLLHGTCVLDTFRKRIGLRTMTMHREKDEWGESFYHEVNGVGIFAMGADYIPEDNILSRMTKERSYELLMQAKQANHNCIRVWGGGLYPAEWFYDICDELGIIVWQDFMFSCAVYPLTPEFEKNITAEFIDNVKRLRNHASLGLWCGNNEMEMFVKQGQWVNRESQRDDYLRMYEQIIPAVLKEYDPQTFYWPASPSSGGGFDAPNDENRGDVHYWDVWHGSKPFPTYRKFYFRYLSEFGFQSFPGLRTCEAFTEPEDRNVFSYVMEKHQRNGAANGKIMNYMEKTFLYPTKFETVLYASQLLQAEAIRYGVEHFRRNRGRCMGTIVWQLNDCWPVASWSSIDYFGRWKALHYYEKRMFAPIMISCAEEGVLTQNEDVNAEPFELKKSIRLNVANETGKDECILVRWALRDASSKVIRSGEEKVEVPALTSVWLSEEDMADAELYENYVSYEAVVNGETVSEGTVLFAQPKFFRFRNPELSVRVEGDEIVVTSKTYAKSVEILNEDETMLLSDNYFDLNGGEKRVKILKGEATGLRVRSVYDIR